MTAIRVNPEYAPAYVGDYYTANWTATESSANNTRLTANTAPLPAGMYLVVVCYPNVSTTSFYAWLIGHIESTNNLMNGSSYARAAFYVQVAQGAQLHLESAQSLACSFSYTERAILRAVRLA